MVSRVGFEPTQVLVMLLELPKCVYQLRYLDMYNSYFYYMKKLLLNQ